MMITLLIANIEPNITIIIVCELISANQAQLCAMPPLRQSIHPRLHEICNSRKAARQNQTRIDSESWTAKLEFSLADRKWLLRDLSLSARNQTINVY
jgi:hypothetical protein